LAWGVIVRHRHREFHNENDKSVVILLTPETSFSQHAQQFDLTPLANWDHEASFHQSDPGEFMRYVSIDTKQTIGLRHDSCTHQENYSIWTGRAGWQI
jgi:hypothetical protein